MEDENYSGYGDEEDSPEPEETVGPIKIMCNDSVIATATTDEEAAEILAEKKSTHRETNSSMNDDRYNRSFHWTVE